MNLKLDKSKWQKVQFGNVVKKVNNKIDPNEYDSDIVIQGGHINKRDFHIRKYEDKKELGYLGPAFHMGFKKEQILYVSRNPHLMKVGYPHFDGICSNTTYIMETKDEDTLRNDLIPFIMHSDTFIEQSVANVRGGVNPYVNWGDLACIEFLLPPRDQQAKIAELLWVMDDFIEKLKLTRDALRLNEKVIIKDLFIAGKNGQNIKSKLGFISNNWECRSLQELLDNDLIISHLDGNHGSFYPKAEEFVNQGVPYISASCIEDGEISLRNAKYLTKDRASVFTKGVARNGDLLLAHNATVGPVCILKTDLEKIILSTTLTYYRVNSKFIDIQYLYYFMQSRIFQSQLEKVMSQSTRNQVPITTQRKLYFLIPPLEKQIVISNSISQIKEPLRDIEGNIKISKKLQKSLINEIFSS